MPRATNSPASRKRRRKVLGQAKGYFGNRSRLYRYANDAVNHALVYAYRDRKTKKRNFRGLWIVRINAACRPLGITYSSLMNGLKKAGIEMDRKAISELAIQDPEAFAVLVNKAKEAVA